MEGEKEIQETFDMLTAEEKSYLIFPQERQQGEQGHQLSGHALGWNLSHCLSYLGLCVAFRKDGNMWNRH